MIRILLLIAAGVIAFGGILLQHKERGFAIAALLAICTLAEGVFTEWAADFVWEVFPSASSAAVSEHVSGTHSSSPQQSEPPAEAGTQGSVGAVSDSTPAPDPAPTPDPAPAPDPAPTPDPDPAPDPAPAPEPADPLSGLTDISGLSAVSGIVLEKDQVNQYRFTAPVDGTYLFDSGLGFGAIQLQLDNAYGGRLTSSSSSLYYDLEAGKSYRFSVAYSHSPLDYTIQIGIPNPVTDITGQTSVTGSLTYLKQNDRYTYTAPISGVYLFDAPGMNFGALRVEVRNAQDQRIAGGSPTASASLEEGKTYTLCVEPSSHLLDYTIQINIPNPPVDVTALGLAAGTLTYSSQKDQYYYTAPADGSYCFRRTENSKSVTMQLLDDQGNSCGISNSSSLTATLKAGTRYVLSVYKQYASLPLQYEIEIIPA